MRIIAFLIIICSSHPLFSQNEIIEENIGELEIYIVDQLNRYNTIKTDSGSISIWYNEIIKQGEIGIYNFGRIGSHGSRSNFFLLQNDRIIVVRYVDYNELQSQIEHFMKDNEFSETDIEKTINAINKIYNEKTGDSF